MTTADNAFADIANWALDDWETADDRPGRNGNRIYLGPILLSIDPTMARITTRPVSSRIVAGELIWMLAGESHSTQYLNHHNIKIWDQWGRPSPTNPAVRDLGPIYGAQWRTPFPATDQISSAIRTIRSSPGSARALVTAWVPSEIPKMSLPPCHFAHQLTAYPDDDTYIVDLHMFQRSCDALVGLPYNMAFYGLLLQWYVHHLNHNPAPDHRPFVCGLLQMHISDLHIYGDHMEVPGVEEWLHDAALVPDDDTPRWTLSADEAMLVPATLPTHPFPLPSPDQFMAHCEPITPLHSLSLKANA